jgi:hypothetical protein
MRPMAKRGPHKERELLELPVPFEDAIKALLATPPPPAGHPATRKLEEKPRRKARKRH